MRFLLLALLLSQPAYSNWFAERRAHKERVAAEKIVQEMADRKERERMIKMRWRQKQYSKVFDGLKGFLSKGRFKYLTIGLLGGMVITSAGIWYWCHDGCRLFNPIEEEKNHGHRH